MLLAVDTRPEVRARVPSIVHVDGSARVQTVERDVEPRYHRLISAFHEITGVPLVLNTSFNGYGEPMVESAADAIRAMHTMGLDAVAIGDYLAWPEHREPSHNSNASPST
jgi:carbamoyltransferase